MRIGTLPRVASVVVLSQFVALASCSKKASEDNHTAQKREGAGTTADDAPATNVPESKTLPATKTSERHATIENARLRSVARQIDDVELQQKKLGPVEVEKRADLNHLRGLPLDAPVEVSNPKFTGKESEEERAALDAYRMVAAELELLEAKMTLFIQQRERVQAAKSANEGKGEDTKRK